MKVLVIGGTGTVGSQVVARLRERNVPVRVLTSSREKLSTLPAGVEGRLGNLRERQTLDQAMEGIERLFLITPLSETETEEGLNAVAAAKSAGVKRIVYQSVMMPEGSAHIPHFASKIPVENAAMASGMQWTVLRPNNFYQNEFWFREAIVRYNLYAQPIGDVGLHRVDVRDIADAAVNALMEDGHHGIIYPINGPDVLTGSRTAEILSRRFGKTITYAGNDLKAWGDAARQSMPGWLVDDFTIMYRFFQEKGMIGSDEQLRQQYSVIGHEPRIYDAYAAELAAMWKHEATPAMGRP